MPRILKTKTGRLFNDDCFDVLPLIADNSVDMILCDLPYGTTKCKWDIKLPLEQLWQEYWRVIKSNGAIVLTGTEPFSSILRCSSIKQYRYDWTWDKVAARGHLTAKKRPMAQSECISVFFKKPSVYNPIMVLRDKPLLRKEYKRSEIFGGVSNGYSKVYTHMYPKTIITINGARRDKNSFHPTQKPVALFEYLIKTYTNEGDLVLDNCSGSGTTAIAAINTNRRWVCIEKDEAYARASKKRIKDHLNALNS